MEGDDETDTVQRHRKIKVKRLRKRVGGERKTERKEIT